LLAAHATAARVNAAVHTCASRTNPADSPKNQQVNLVCIWARATAGRYWLLQSSLWDSCTHCRHPHRPCGSAIQQRRLH